MFNVQKCAGIKPDKKIYALKMSFGMMQWFITGEQSPLLLTHTYIEEVVAKGENIEKRGAQAMRTFIEMFFFGCHLFIYEVKRNSKHL